MKGKRHSKKTRIAIRGTAFAIGLITGLLIGEALGEEETAMELTPQTTIEEADLAPVHLDPRDVEILGRAIWTEAGGVESKAERAAVAWCVLNRSDATGMSIEAVVTEPGQFVGYTPDGDCPLEHLNLAADVLQRWHAEKDGAEDVGRVLPESYIYFTGDGTRNHFTQTWGSSDTWDWTLPDPYTN